MKSVILLPEGSPAVVRAIRRRPNPSNRTRDAESMVNKTLNMLKLNGIGLKLRIPMISPVSTDIISLGIPG